MTTEIKEELFLTAMCNFFGMGLEAGYGLELDYNDEEYQKAREAIRSTLIDPCWGNVLLAMLKQGYTLSLKDIEGEGEMNASITLQDVHERMDLVPERVLRSFEEENDDAGDADALLQTIFYKEIIFG
jgi:hypothetical protein